MVSGTHLPHSLVETRWWLGKNGGLKKLGEFAKNKNFFEKFKCIIYNMEKLCYHVSIKGLSIDLIIKRGTTLWQKK